MDDRAANPEEFLSRDPVRTASPSDGVVLCEHCGAELLSSDSSLLKHGRCPRCWMPFLPPPAASQPPTIVFAEYQEESPEPVQAAVETLPPAPDTEPVPEAAVAPADDDEIDTPAAAASEPPPLPQSAEVSTDDFRSRLRQWLASYGISTAIHTLLLLFLALVAIQEHYRRQADAIVGSMEDGGGEFGFAELELPPLAAEPEDAPAVQVTELFEMSVNPLMNAAPEAGGAMDGGGVGFFGTRARGNSFVFIVDRSGSMAIPMPVEADRRQRNPQMIPRMQAAVGELERALRQLASDQSFYVIFYDDFAYPVFYPEVSLRMLEATPKNIDKVLKWEQTLIGGGGTDPREAMEVALRLKPDVVFFLTDGEIPEDTPQLVRTLNRGQSTIHTTCVGSEVSPLLSAIAAENGGRFRGVTRLQIGEPKQQKEADPETVEVVLLSFTDNSDDVGRRTLGLLKALEEVPASISRRLNDPVAGQKRIYVCSHNAFASVADYANELQTLVRETTRPRDANLNRPIRDGLLGYPYLPHRADAPPTDAQIEVYHASSQPIFDFLQETSNHQLEEGKFVIKTVVLFGDEDSRREVRNVLDVATLFNRLKVEVIEGDRFLRQLSQ